MKRLLLDTNALIWWGQGSDRVAIVRESLAYSDTVVLVSMACFWEIATKERSRGKIVDIASFARRATGAGMRLTAIEVAHLDALLRLPSHHRDPFDLLIIAQALVEGATIVTADRIFARYDVPVIAL